MSMYQAGSLDDIARHFEQMAGRASVRAGHATATERKLLEREAVIWRQAATMLLQTTLVSEAK